MGNALSLVPPSTCIHHRTNGNVYLLSWGASPGPWWGEFGRQRPFPECALRNSSVHSRHRDLLLHPPALPTVITGEKRTALQEAAKECSKSKPGQYCSPEKRKNKPANKDRSTHKAIKYHFPEGNSQHPARPKHCHYLVTEGHRAIYVQTVFTL